MVDALTAFLEIDLTSGQGAALLASVERVHGPAILQILSPQTRLFLLRSRWAPGLRFVGAQSRAPAQPDADVTAPNLSVSGVGETVEAAFASCLGEMAERSAQFSRERIESLTATMADMHARIMPAVLPLIIDDLATAGLSELTPLPWTVGTGLAPNAFAGQDVVVPADWCFHPAVERARLRPRSALSTGTAAGPDFEWAATRALLELVERDAASLWWIGGRGGKPIATDDPAVERIVRLLASLRMETRARTTWLLDITTELAIPVVAALSCSAEGKQLACGTAARLTLGEAACAAILELCQMELSLLLAAWKRTESGAGGLTPEERNLLARARDLDVGKCTLLQPTGLPAAHSAIRSGPELGVLAAILGDAGLQTALVPMTPPDQKIPVVRAIVPALQPMPSHFVTARMKDVCAETGGGDQHTGRHALM